MFDNLQICAATPQGLNLISSILFEPLPLLCFIMHCDKHLVCLMYIALISLHDTRQHTNPIMSLGIVLPSPIRNGYTLA